MKNSKEYASRFAGHLKMLRNGRAPESPPASPSSLTSSDPIDALSTLVFSFLLWESNHTKATNAFQRVQSQLVDYNELRVCMPSELTTLLGVRYPLVKERCERLRSVLNDIYQRETDVTLAPLAEMTRGDARAYLDNLEGMVPFVSARVVLVALDIPAVPVDEQLRVKLATNNLIDSETTVEEVQRWIERNLKAGECREAHLLLQHWVENTD